MAAARNAIETNGLTKHYGALTALDSVTFEVARGELFGLIGPDGAGKTTLFGVDAAANRDLIAPIYRQIEPFRTRRAGKLSGGMKQKLALCCALIHRPSVLLLDEPTTGVDAVSRNEFWDMLSELKSKGISMLVSTPYMDEARRCDRIALCNEGKILGIDTPQGIVGRFDGPLYALSGRDMYGLLLAARHSAGVTT